MSQGDTISSRELLGKGVLMRAKLLFGQNNSHSRRDQGCHLSVHHDLKEWGSLKSNMLACGDRLKLPLKASICGSKGGAKIPQMLSIKKIFSSCSFIKIFT